MGWLGFLDCRDDKSLPSKNLLGESKLIYMNPLVDCVELTRRGSRVYRNGDQC